MASPRSSPFTSISVSAAARARPRARPACPSAALRRRAGRSSARAAPLGRRSWARCSWASFPAPAAGAAAGPGAALSAMGTPAPRPRHRRPRRFPRPGDGRLLPALPAGRSAPPRPSAQRAPRGTGRGAGGVRAAPPLPRRQPRHGPAAVAGRLGRGGAARAGVLRRAPAARGRSARARALARGTPLPRGRRLRGHQRGRLRRGHARIRPSPRPAGGRLAAGSGTSPSCWRAPAARPVPLTVAYHDACHLAHGQHVREAPRAFLRSIPGLRLVELPESTSAAGSRRLQPAGAPDGRPAPRAKARPDRARAPASWPPATRAASSSSAAGSPTAASGSAPTIRSSSWPGRSRGPCRRRGAKAWTRPPRTPLRELGQRSSRDLRDIARKQLVTRASLRVVVGQGRWPKKPSATSRSARSRPSSPGSSR